MEASDGLSLSGFEMVPATAGTPGIVWLHGFGVGYDLPECIRLGRELAGRGLGFLAGNLRGHDGAAVGWRRSGGRTDIVKVGSWWEVFEESAMDAAAWTDRARELGFAPLFLAGHSFGAPRAVYYVSAAKPDGLAGLALVSPSFGLTHLDPAVAELAASWVAAGRGAELLPAGSWARGFGTDTVSAQTYASWWRVSPTLYGDERSRFADISCPLLVLYGTDGDGGGEPEARFIQRAALAAPRFDWSLVPGMRHRYSGSEAVLAARVAKWIGGLTAKAG